MSATVTNGVKMFAAWILDSVGKLMRSLIFSIRFSDLDRLYF
jgi:hypothetical protein